MEPGHQRGELLAFADGQLSATVVEVLRDAVIALTQRLHADLPPADVHATRRTLNLLAERARALARADD